MKQLKIVNNGANASATLSSIGAKIMSGEVTQFPITIRYLLARCRKSL